MRSRIDWVHPSYRDLVIDELCRDSQLGRTFLSSMSIDGAILAVSSSGGAKGERYLPLMNFHDSWEILDERCLELVGREPLEEVVRLVQALTEVSMVGEMKILHILKKICKRLVETWNSKNEPLT